MAKLTLEEVPCIEAVTRNDGITWARVAAVRAMSDVGDDNEVALALDLADRLRVQTRDLERFVEAKHVEQMQREVRAAAWMREKLLALVEDLEPDCATDQPLMEALKDIAELEGFDEAQ